MAVLNTPRLDLPYPDGNDLLRDGDNRIHDLAAALDEIVATVDELAAIELTPGPPGPEGPSGQSAGKIFYYATSDASDIATYKTLLESPSAGSEQTVAVACTGTSDVLVGAFASEPGIPGAVDYPAGTAFRRIYAKTDAGVARLHIQVYKRDAAGTETLVRDEFSNNFVNTTVALQEWIATSAAAGALTATDRIVTKLYAQRVSGTSTINVTVYFEGTAHTSHIQTTISAGAQGPVGPPGPAGSTYTRATATYTTASLATNAAENTGAITLANGYRLYKVTTNRPARVRVYTTAAKRTADAARAVGTDPTGDHGLMLEYVTTAGVLTADLSPTVDGFDGESTPTGAIPISITNLDASTGTVTVTLTWIRTE